MQIKKLTWDSDFFNYPIGKLEIKDIAYFKLNEFIDVAKQYRLVYVFSDSPLEARFLRLVDIRTSLLQKLTCNSNATLQDSYVISFSKKIHSFENLKKLALESGVYSRFKTDSNFTKNEYARLYERWIENLVLKEKALDIGIYYSSGKILGFISLEEKTTELADIGLVAVDPKARGMGIGTKLVENAKRKAYEKGIKKIQVVTQGANLSAINLYERCNFKIVEQKYIYHYWNK